MITVCIFLLLQVIQVRKLTGQDSGKIFAMKVLKKACFPVLFLFLLHYRFITIMKK